MHAGDGGREVAAGVVLVEVAVVVEVVVDAGVVLMLVVEAIIECQNDMLSITTTTTMSSLRLPLPPLLSTQSPQPTPSQHLTLPLPTSSPQPTHHHSILPCHICNTTSHAAINLYHDGYTQHLSSRRNKTITFSREM
ncbi:hypothetical protein Pcinc_001865 [Petrolisthes cinctipes]|uniref:Uncharacterized protein n=1 Tax=Petrolisthes cinctipes TaxID=88211 RepID=A0AAE1GKI7_PETCI|nr:hypothetical protein Pcinc_001865 [Petrolisthes cinctipes]